MKDYDKNKECSYLLYWNVNNLFAWPMSEKLLVNNSQSIKDPSQFIEDFIKKYNEMSDEGYFVEVNVQYFEKLHEPDNDLPFLLFIMEIEKVKNLVAKLHDQTEYVIHIRNLKQSLHLGLASKKNYIELWNLELYIYMTTDLGKTAKNKFEKKNLSYRMS